MAVVRTRGLWDLATERPAAWALLGRVSVVKPPVQGCADDRGRIAL